MQLAGLFAFVILLSAGVNAQENATETIESKRTSRQHILIDDPYDLIGPVYWPSRSFYYYRNYPWLAAYLPKDAPEESFATFKSNSDDKNAIDLPAARLGGFASSILNAGLFNNRYVHNNNYNNNRFRLFPYFNPARFPLMINPYATGAWRKYESCVSVDGDAGICTPSSICGVFNGRSSGSCPYGGICCVNTVTKCGATVSLNNTYWQSPTNFLGSTSTCSLNVRLDTRLHEQKQPICQVRLDMLSFSIAQPNPEGVCVYDTFQAGGGTNTVPVICGDNGGQHMYINVPNSGQIATDLQFIFTFGNSVSFPRSWSIKIAMLPCGVDYLAPVDCLQYFTSNSGTVSSFNWKDVPLAVRQLANQDYQICFRSEVVSGAKTSSLCFAQCNTNNQNVAFRLTGNTVISQLAGLPGACSNDFLLIPNGFDPTPAFGQLAGVPGAYTDRFCGGVFNAGSAAIAPGTVCTNVKPFRILYRTNGDETITATADGIGGALPLPANNMGFCLTYLQRAT